MHYCSKCVYPENAKPGVIIHDDGICSGCKVVESRDNIEWKEREDIFVEILNEHKFKQEKKKNPYHCIIPVSGGKDSTYQTWLIKKKYKLNPLLVSYNHTFNTPLGLRNLTNLIETLNCNLVRYTTAPQTAIKLAEYMLKKVGDVTWHYHAGIQTFPIQASVAFDVPLIVWGEEGLSQMLGMFNQDDYVEFTKKKRQEHSMRGFEPEDILAEKNCPFDRYELAPFFYPDDKVIEKVGTRGIYISNYLNWNAKKQTEFIIKELGFETSQGRERTFNLYDKLDDIHANGLHDYLKYLKFGYGRCTDDASTEIRYGRMTREEGIEMVEKYDPVVPSDLKIFLKKTGMTEKEFYGIIDIHRDPLIWKKKNGKWIKTDSIKNHSNKTNVKNPPKHNEKNFIKTKEKISTHSQKTSKQNDYVIL